MSKQYQGSKKKARKIAFLERQAKKEAAKRIRRSFDDSMSRGDIEKAASIMGIPLK